MHPTPHAIRRLRLLGLGALLTSANLVHAQSSAPSAASTAASTSFSSATPGSDLPADWKNLPVAHGKTPTHYGFVTDAGVTVIEANSADSASALMHDGNIDLEQTPMLSWRWKVEHAIPSADNTVAALEDSPARLILVFDGDKSRLSLGERTTIHLAKAVGGQELPYATLMYIWSNNAPVGSVIPNPHTDRIQMIVTAGGDATLGNWQNFSRNVTEDYQRVFHEKPGKLLAYGILTDSDNTHASAHAWYGDIRFKPLP